MTSLFAAVILTINTNIELCCHLLILAYVYTKMITLKLLNYLKAFYKEMS